MCIGPDRLANVRKPRASHYQTTDHICRMHKIPGLRPCAGPPATVRVDLRVVCGCVHAVGVASPLCVTSISKGESSVAAGVEFERTWRMLLNQPKQQVGWLIDLLQAPRAHDLKRFMKSTQRSRRRHSLSAAAASACCTAC